MSHITTQLYLPSKAKKYWGCPKISTIQHRGIHPAGEAAGSGERGGERKGGEVGGGKLELGKRAKRRAKPFSISQRDYKGLRAAELRLLSSSGFYHCWGILAGRERERARDPMATSVCRGDSVSPPVPLSSQA